MVLGRKCSECSVVDVFSFLVAGCNLLTRPRPLTTAMQCTTPLILPLLYPTVSSTSPYLPLHSFPSPYSYLHFIPFLAGDINRPEVLRNFDVGRARAVVFAIDDKAATNKVI